jgi:isoquinoline 1-oxidoreductase subunit alpha
MPELELIVNGQEYRVDVPDDIPLLWVLREWLGLTGTKYSCGIGRCGACTVHIDGEATRACITSAREATSSQITTIEGLSLAGDHPLQIAWEEENVPQCGYCQPGQIMQAAALLTQNPNPTDEDIIKAMSNVLCRCGTYQRILSAIHGVVEMGGES